MINNNEVARLGNPAALRHARVQAVVDGLTLASLVGKTLIDYLTQETVFKKANIIVGEGG